MPPFKTVLGGACDITVCSSNAIIEAFKRVYYIWEENLQVIKNQSDLFVLAAIGFVTGIATVMLQPFDGLAYEAMDTVAQGAGPFSEVVEFVFSVSSGLVFGAAGGWWLYVRSRRSVWRWIAFAVAGGASWYLAILSALNYENLVPFDISEYGVAGLVGGFVGALVIAASAALLYPFARRPALFAALLAVGTVAGVLLYFETGDKPPVILFLVWQTGVAGTLGVWLSKAHKDMRGR